MEFERFEKNIIDNITEAQLKLGWDNRPINLNYTLSSLSHLLGTEKENVSEALEKFAVYTASNLGKISFRPIKDGFCLTIPSEGTAFVHENINDSGFISELVNLVSKHGISMEEVTELFRKHCPDTVIKESKNEEFDILAYFPDGCPDEYFYCLAAEPCIGGGCHITYHRFIREDYEEFGF